ncbi:unnamed protein product, partial [Rotaria socialis]
RQLFWLSVVLTTNYAFAKNRNNNNNNSLLILILTMLEYSINYQDETPNARFPSSSV